MDRSPTYGKEYGENEWNYALKNTNTINPEGRIKIPYGANNQYSKTHPKQTGVY